MFLSLFSADAGGGDRSPWGDFWFNPVEGGGRVSADASMRLSAVCA
jgi:hypothetical protein